MRGKPDKKQALLDTVGITPADAGKTSEAVLMPKKVQDHPRGCGENVAILQYLLFPQGSPPRMRGKLSLFSGIVRITGITPADAGKTCGLGVLQRAHEDHPRGCGENFACGAGGDVIKGSPPRMRGKLRPYQNDCIRSRITPADAGKTLLAEQAEML